MPFLPFASCAMLCCVLNPSMNFKFALKFEVRRAIAATLTKFQIPGLTYKGYCVSGTAAPPGNDATRRHVLRTKERKLYVFCL